MLSAEEIIDALATWIREDHAVKVAAVKLPMGAASTCVRQAVDRACAEPVWLSMGGVAGVDIASAAKSPMAVTFKKKVIVVDEFDAIVQSDQSIFAQISAAIKVNKVPVVLVANSFRSKASELPKGHAFFELDAAPGEDIRVIFSATPDTSNDKGLAGAGEALMGVERDYRGDGIALGGVFDNYLQSTTREVWAVAESFSSTDVTTEGMCRAGFFDDPYSFIPVSMAAHVFRDAPAPVTIATFGTVWSKTNAMYAKVNGSRATAKTIRDAGKSVQTLGPSTGLDFLRLMIQSALARNDIQGAADVARAAGLDAPGVLVIMRLWKSKYTLATHGKIKKLLAVIP